MSNNINTLKINYVIATHALNTITRQKYGTDNFTSYSLRYHLYILSQTLTSESNIKQITIVKPDVEDTVDYYNISPYDKILEDKGIKIEYFAVENKGISYTQYLKCFKQYTTFDYYLIFEDDYTINIKYKDFDKLLVDLYKKTFLNNIGFLDCWSPLDGIHELHMHSAITLGIMSRSTIDRFLTNLNPSYYDQFSFDQFAFSQELTKNNIPIIDMNRAGFLTKVFYWSTGYGRIEDYSNNDANDAFYVPIQYYYDNIGYQNKTTNVIYNVTNNFGIHTV